MSDDDNKQLDLLLAGLFARQLAGESVGVDTLVAARPDLADELRARWADLERLDALWTRSSISSKTGSFSACLQPGDKVDAFEIIREIGRGGMGIVFLARQPALGRDIALKALPNAPGLSEHSRQRFLREARAVGTVAHPNVIHIHAIGETAGSLYIAMELVEGVSLSQILAAIRCRQYDADASSIWEQRIRSNATDEAPARSTPQYTVRLDPPYVRRVCELVTKIARGLHAAHESGVVHRDVKPSNILINRNGEPKIIDFGLAAIAWEPHVTLSGEFFGTPHYASPEQARGKRGEIDRRSDIYSLGATLYECLTLSTPFQGESAAAVLTEVISATPRRPRHLNRALARDLETIVEKCLEKEPSLRYATTADLADDIENFLSYRPIKARHAGGVVRARKFLRRHPVLPILSILLVALCTLGLATGRYWTQAAHRQQDARFRDFVDSADILADVIQMPWLQTQLGQEFRQRKEESERLLSDALQIYPTDFWARMQRARVRISLGRNSVDIVDDLRAAATSHPSANSPRVFEALIESGQPLEWRSNRWWNGKSEQAISRSYEGTSADDSYFLACAAYFDNDRVAALKHLNRALTQRADHYWARVARIRSADDLKQIGAEQHAVLAQRPKCVVSYYVNAHRTNETRQDAEEARRIIEAGLELVPDDLVLLQAMARLHDWDFKDPAAALPWAERALATKESEDTRRGVASVLEKLGRFEEALQNYCRAEQFAENPATSLSSQATVLEKLGRLDEAVARCEAAIQADQRYLHAKGVLARLEAARGNAPRAVEILLALKLEDEHFYAERAEYADLARYLEDLGDLSAAEREFAEGIALADRLELHVMPYDRMLHAALRTRLYGAGSGVSVFEEAERRSQPDPDLLIAYADYLSSLGRFDEAIARFQRAVSLYRKRADAANARISLAFTLEKAGRLDAALDEYLIVISDQPYEPSSYCNACRVLLKLSRPDEAITVAERGLEKSGPSPELLHALGKAHLANSAPDDAVLTLRRALLLIVEECHIHKNPDKELLTDLAAAFRSTGRANEIDSLFQDIRQNGKLPPAFRLRAALCRAQALLASGDLARAEQAAQAAARLDEERAGDWEGFLLLGKIQLERGKLHEAMVSLAVSTEHAPNGPGEAHGLLITLMRRRGWSEEALKRVDAWIAKGFTNPWGMRVSQPYFEAEYRLFRSLLLLDVKRPSEALEELDKALRMIRHDGGASAGDDYVVTLIHDEAGRLGATDCAALASEFLSRPKVQALLSGKSTQGDHLLRYPNRPNADSPKARAMQLKAQGRLDDAEKCLREELSRCDGLGPDHPEKISAIMDLSLLLAERSKFDEAEQLVRPTVSWAKRVFDQDNWMAIATKGTLGGVLAMQRKWQEAQSLLEEAIQKGSRCAEIPDDWINGWRVQFVGCLVAAKKHGDAIFHLRICHEFFRKSLGDDHPQTQAAAQWIAELAEKIGRSDDAAAYRPMPTSSKQPATASMPVAVDRDGK